MYNGQHVRESGHLRVASRLSSSRAIITSAVAGNLGGEKPVRRLFVQQTRLYDIGEALQVTTSSQCCHKLDAGRQVRQLMVQVA